MNTTTQVAFRFENSLIERLDRFAERITATSGMKATRADSVRILIEAALKAADGDPFQLPMGLTAVPQAEPAPTAVKARTPKAPKAKPPAGLSRKRPEGKPDKPDSDA